MEEIEKFFIDFHSIAPSLDAELTMYLHRYVLNDWRQKLRALGTTL